MGSFKRPRRIKKSDYLRVVVTETVPYETPVIFSNEGLYNNIKGEHAGPKLWNLLLDNLVTGAKMLTASTVPFRYKIRHDATSFRRLCLLHPAAQVQIRHFYEKYETLILHFCKRSPASIRAPHSIAGTFYSKSSWENVYQYRADMISEKQIDPFTKYSPSFFSYSGYDRLYKFFDSAEFLDLERRFAFLWSLDVSKCFDSIYTHCLSWALKDKHFTKKHVDSSATFGQAFDGLMQRANHNETHGIVIGPEVSRIFAELLFQTIDCRVIVKLAKKEMEFDRDFSFKRYVDDVFIFARTESVAQAVYSCYDDTLSDFNLRANPLKNDQFKRPFMTKKSRIIREISNVSNEFFDAFLVEQGVAALSPKRIYDRARFTRAFIARVKTILSYNAVPYDEVSSYLISVLTERIKKLVSRGTDGITEENRVHYRDAIIVLVDVLYFLYAVSPSVAASYKLCTAIIIVTKFAKQNLGSYEHTIKQQIFDLTETLLSNEGDRQPTMVEGFVHLEALNVILAARELGEHYLLPESIIGSLFRHPGDFSYFAVISCLFYIRDSPEYKGVRRKLIQAIDRGLGNLSEAPRDAETICLFLDVLACPYILPAKKIRWVSQLFHHLELPAPSARDVGELLQVASARPWFVNWGELDLLNSLEKKELKRAY
jgi:hypothetical protein